MNNRIYKEKIEFYINNTCNYNCDNCNRLNNYHFSGYDRWQKYEDQYRIWKEKIDFGEITVLGGEPTLNPTLDEWIIGIRNFWPTAKLNILTNGTRLKYWQKRNLFKILGDTDTKLCITLHNRSRRDELIKEICGYLSAPVVAFKDNPFLSWADCYNQVKDSNWPKCTDYGDFENLPDWIQQECREVHGIDWPNWVKNTGTCTIVDSKGNIDITIDYAENFVTAPLKYVGNHQFSVYASDPKAAHSVCISRTCTHMIKAKMYKCHHVALLPEFAKQFDVKMTEQDQKLLEDYVPLEPHVNRSEMQSFINNLEEVIPQCRLCPCKIYSVPTLKSNLSKPKINKIIAIKSLLAT